MPLLFYDSLRAHNLPGFFSLPFPGFPPLRGLEVSFLNPIFSCFRPGVFSPFAFPFAHSDLLLTYLLQKPFYICFH